MAQCKVGLLYGLCVCANRQRHGSLCENILMLYFYLLQIGRGMDELAGHKPTIPSGICYEQKHPCIGGLCWCCLGDHYNCYSTQDECKGSCTET
jgi:hypothetical protein